jgi:hypothetical protein
MKVRIKDLSVDMEVKNNGVEFEVRDTSEKFLGDCIVTKTGLIWCKGKTSKSNGKSISWTKFIDMMEN